MSGTFYPFSLAGVRNYQSAISECSEGDGLLVWHEPDNPYDDRALAVTTASGQTIGYLPRGSVLHTACLDERKGCEARILQLHANQAGEGRAVVIEAALHPKGLWVLGVRQFTRA